MIELILVFFGQYLIEVMLVVVAIALSLRWMSYNHSKRDEAYFSHFTRELASTLSSDKEKGARIENVSDSLNNILGRVNQKLPERNLRKGFSKSSNETTDDRMVGLTLKEYVGSKHGLIANIQSEAGIFTSHVQPDFSQLTERVMSEDDNWSKLFNRIPIDGVTRVLDVLPTMFIILGVFGTFIGISMALPEIAKMDFANLEESGKTLSQFVVNVTFAMKTSIAGIFFSILLTTLNTVSPIEITRENTFEKVEVVLQTLWYHLHAERDKSSAEKELPMIRKVMEELLEEVRVNRLALNEKEIKKAS
ncbi:hypothetical protein A9Q84_17580 [Halobacteriovorax marinus]|uniref:MotA/TolQ/ExbB proton channel domain-containing protein n=1 Tax=Halobacteriovorax marinus TaxID=97084 RepID=A0A1Y5F350_9BACT|nr:hypothetical protein A9Q84_17580 [Halobacteriovorax marinus]